MKHPIYQVVKFDIVGPNILRVTFDDGKERVIDFRPVLTGELYGPLHCTNLFGQVEIDPKIHTLVWPIILRNPPLEEGPFRTKSVLSFLQWSHDSLNDNKFLTTL